MINNRKVIALIQIREGSQRVPGKNFKEIAGSTLTERAYQKCRNSEYIDEIYVSTSSQKYKDVISSWECKVIDRPDELSEPGVPNLPVYKHAVTKMHISDNDYVVHVDVTKPFTSTQQIDEVIEKADGFKFQTCFTMKSMSFCPIGEYYSQSQEYDKVRLHYGAVRLFTKRAIEQAKLGTWGESDKHGWYIMPNWHVDIDTDEDWKVAEALLKAGIDK